MSTVLIADDDAAVRRLLVSLLRPHGHRLLEAADGEQALALAQTEHPDVIVSDLLMPAMDGYELVRQLRSGADTARTPVVFLSAEYDNEEARELAQSAGAVRILRKPCAAADVLAAVDAALDDGPAAKALDITDTFDVRHMRLMTDKLTRQAAELREANTVLEAHAAQLEAEIAERKRAAEKLDHLNRVHSMLSSINGLIMREREREGLFNEACRVAVQHGKFPLAWIGLVTEDGANITPVAWAGRDQAFAQRIGTARPVINSASKRSLAREAIETQRPSVCNDIARDEPHLVSGDYMVAAGHRSAIVLPLIVASRVRGVLALYTPEPSFFNEADIRLLVELAGNIAFALDHIDKTERLDYLAYYDSLTGLANRTLLLQRLSRDLESASAAHRSLALVIFDIDRFEGVNDSFGRHVGDQVLKVAAERLVQCVGDPSRTSRVGPDDLAALIPEVGSESDVARTVGEWRQALFGTPVRTTAAELRLSGRAGMALFPADGSDPETLLRHAQAALKKCKASGDAYLFYTQDMSVRTAERLALEIKLRDGLEKEEFVLHYQPKVDGITGRLSGVEALIRWLSPDLGLVPPAQFIPLMEETGIIVEAGRWALRQAIADRWRWIEAGLPPPRIALNVSTVELRRHDFVRVFSQTLKSAGDDHGIDIEVTESLIMEDVTSNMRKLAALRDLGVTIAVDDFGTGYSSLAYLARLPVQTLKIDRTFVAAMLDDPGVMTLVSTIISLARSLRLGIIAEGVETAEQAKMLQLLRCDQLQGHLYGKPLPFDELTDRLRRSRG
jgi:diguanylate cyclase (GGDEF)-like protein